MLAAPYSFNYVRSYGKSISITDIVYDDQSISPVYDFITSKFILWNDEQLVFGGHVWVMLWYNMRERERWIGAFLTFSLKLPDVSSNLILFFIKKLLIGFL